MDVPLAPLTTFQIGGPAEMFFEAATPNELARAVCVVRELGIPFLVLGRGANILIGDKGFPGLIIHNRAVHISIDEASGTLTAGSGAIVYPNVIEAAVTAGLSGLEHYVGIPSTVGGALWQNLHFLSPAPKRERTMFIEEVLLNAKLLLESGETRRVGVDYFEFGYDQSILHSRDDTVLEATFQLASAPEATMRRVMRENLEWRSERHPPLDTEPSVGSIFKKIDGMGAGRLIDGCGLKGTKIGGVEISPRHANILVNRGGATARDVREIINLVQTTVHRHTGYLLEPEISFIGEF